MPEKGKELVIPPEAFSADARTNGPMTPGLLGTDIYRYVRRYKAANLNVGILNYFNNGFFGRYIADEEISLPEVMRHVPGNKYNQFTGKLMEGVAAAAGLLAIPEAQAHTACEVETLSGVDVFLTRNQWTPSLTALGIEVKGSLTGATTHRLTDNQIDKIMENSDIKCLVEVQSEHQAYHLTGFEFRLHRGYDLVNNLTPNGRLNRASDADTSWISFSELIEEINYYYG